jgi:vacuolar-type H+-ATPase subunit H
LEVVMRRQRPSAIQGEAQPELSPLDQIRQAEAEAARLIASASMAAEVAISQANVQAAQIKSMATETGRQSGLSQYQEIIAKAKLEAQELTKQAKHDAQQFLIRGNSRMDDAVDWIVNVILGQDEEAGQHEH